MVNIFAPNDSTQQVKFFEDLQGLLTPFSGENTIIGGDFNCPLMSADKQGGRSVHFKQNVIDDITNSLRCTHYATCGREKNGDKQGFSCRNKAMKVQFRLDYFLISKRLLNISKQCVLLFAPNTDHSAVVTHINSKELSRKLGPGFRKKTLSMLMEFRNAFNWQRLLTKTLKTPANLGFDQNGITRLHAKNKTKDRARRSLKTK